MSDTAPAPADEASGQLALGATRRESITAGGIRLAALRSGPAAGPPVLLLPGYTGSKEDFGPIMGPLAAAGYQVTALDLPGQYESPALPTTGEHAPDELAPMILDVLAALGPPVHLLGHSYGGLVARSAVIAGAASGLIRSLVLMDSGPAQIGGERRTMIDHLAPVLELGGMPLVYTAIQAAAAARPDYREPAPALAEFLKRRFLASDPVMMRGMGEALATEPDRVGELARALAGHAIDALVIFGVDDDVWSAQVQAEMARRLSAPYHQVPDSAHSPAVENPADTVARLVAFWRSVR
ncbi:MAG TPA: alpha/beta fold hydrolase [Jatrophihabitantaceae bacterium]|jgi:pimeloyl-ACP methyl ester carboxylesterase|nr:alpha/beta fold hydrolase [Jatrophihabitantaceae bacterium]